jgi:hypothetical protein
MSHNKTFYCANPNLSLKPGDLVRSQYIYKVPWVAISNTYKILIREDNQLMCVYVHIYMGTHIKQTPNYPQVDNLFSVLARNFQNPLITDYSFLY